MLGIGVTVRVLPPFSDAYPGEFVIEAPSEGGSWKIAGGIDFDPKYLEII